MDWPRVKELFNAALDREPAARAAFLNASCDDAAVRSEVERLLAAHEEAGEFIERSPVAVAGRVIDHYKVEWSIGAGGMGEVFRARDLELGREVAIKIALGGDADLQARLKREAQHASQLNHPNICTIYEVGESGGAPFIVMELVDGDRLTDLISRGAGLPGQEIVRYGLQMAAALEHAHQHGVIHRDLKSANVMVTRDGRIKVLDFGLARRHSSDHLRGLSESRDTLAAPGVVAGTLSAMAPELLRGGTADARSDIWALGVLLYEMAAGTMPFAGATGFELSGAILHEAPAALRASIPDPLRGVIARCLEKNPAARYQSASDIRVALEGVPVETPDAGEVRRALEPSAWHKVSVPGSRGIAVAAAAAVLAVLLASVPALWRRIHPLPAGAESAAFAGPRVLAVKSFDNVAGTPELAWLSQGVPRMLSTGLAQTRGLQVVSAYRLDEAAKLVANRALDGLSSGEFAEVARRSGAGALVTGSIMKAGEEIRIDVELQDLASGRVLSAESGRGTDVFAIADYLVARLRNAVGFSDTAGVRHVADVSSSSLEAYRLYSEGVEATMNARSLDAIRLLEAAVAIDRGFAEAYLQLALAEAGRSQRLSRENYLREAEKFADRLSDRQKRLLELELARTAGPPEQTARLLDELMAAYPDVEEIYGAATSLYNPIFGSLSDPQRLLAITENGVKTLPTSGPARNSLGYGLLAAGRFEDAVRQFEEYARLAPREPNPYDSMGEAYLFLGRPEDAARRYAQTRSIDPGFNVGRIGESLSLATLGRYDAAISLNPPQPVLKALLLSRVGRYREAGETLMAAGRDRERSASIAACLLASIVALERNDASRALREVASAERVLAEEDPSRQPLLVLLTQVLAGLASARHGDEAAARSRLERIRGLHNPAIEAHAWLYQALGAELALARGDRLDAAAVANGEPTRKWFGLDVIGIGAVANHLPLRDVTARAAKAGGDLATAIASYRQLLAFGPESKWISVLEPRYVLELARLLEKSGDRAGALREYERFLDLWKNADSGLPELAETRRAASRLRLVDGR